MIRFGAFTDTQTDLVRAQAAEEERALIERAKSQSDAFEELYTRYYGKIFSFAYRRLHSRELAEDITADVFMKALDALPRFTWQGVSVSAWLYRIANNRITDHFRRKGQSGKGVLNIDDVKTLVDERPLADLEDAALRQSPCQFRGVAQGGGRVDVVARADLARDDLRQRRASVSRVPQ